VDDAFGFALTWNYWFNDAVSTASDLVALQLILQYWTDNFPGWALSLIFWAVLIGVNLATVAAYGELEYWLSLLKVITIIVSGIVMGMMQTPQLTRHHRSSSLSESPSTAVQTLPTTTSVVRTGASLMRPLSVVLAASLPSS
jgi:amino acid permease